MSLVPTRLLVINNQVKFSAGLKRALEQSGGFEVAAFASPLSAMEYARNRALSVVMLDFRTKDGSSPVELIQELRALQPDIAIVVSPINAETSAAARELDLQAVIDIPISARRAIPILRKAVTDALNNLPDTIAAPPINIDTTALMPSEPAAVPPPPAAGNKAFSSLSSVLQNMGDPITPDGSQTLKVDMSDLSSQEAGIPSVMPISDAEAEDAFRLLMEQEPPPPTFEESGTLHDVFAAMSDPDSAELREMLDILKSAEVQEPPPMPETWYDEHGDSDGIPNLARQILMNMQDAQAPLEVLQATADAAILPADMAWMTDDEREEVLSKSSLMPPVREKDTPPIPAPTTSPEVARLALQLTQASLELSAAATVLSDSSGIVASAGLLPEEDIEDFRAYLADEWGASSRGERLRYATLPSSGKEYLLYSRMTETGYMLTVIFEGRTPLRVIRRQSERLVEALNDAPQVIQEVTAGGSISHAHAPAYDGVRLPHAFVWVLDLQHPPLEANVRQAIIAGMDIRLTKEAWLIHTLEVGDEWIYLQADVPGERPQNELITELKRLSAQIASARNPMLRAEGLWSDAYMILVPGRALTAEEIERFVAFGR